MGSSTFACKRISVPSRLIAGWVFKRAKRIDTLSNSTRRLSNRFSVSALGLTTIKPADPSTSTRSPVRTPPISPTTPKTLGMASARAIIAVWPSAPPRRVPVPLTLVGSNCAISAGLKFSAITILPFGNALSGLSGCLPKFKRIRFPTSRISSNRAAIYASSIA